MATQFSNFIAEQQLAEIEERLVINGQVEQIVQESVNGEWSEQLSAESLFESLGI